MTGRIEFAPFREWLFELWAFFFAKWQRLSNWFEELKQSIFEAELVTVGMMAILAVFMIILTLVLALVYRFLIFSWLEFAWKWPASFLLAIMSAVVYCLLSEQADKKRQ